MFLLLLCSLYHSISLSLSRSVLPSLFSFPFPDICWPFAFLFIMGIVIVYVYISMGMWGSVANEVLGRRPGCCIFIHLPMFVRGGGRGRGAVDYLFFSPKIHALTSCTGICNITLSEISITNFLRLLSWVKVILKGFLEM